MAMKVYNLACETMDHRFEGWFSSEQDFVKQMEQQMLSCPICGSQQIKKLLSAPRLNLAQAKPPEVKPQPGKELTPAVQMQSQMMEALRKVLANTEDVGSRFAEEARRIHYQETPVRAIRGVVSRAEHEALQDEGIDVLALPALPSVSDGGNLH